MNYVESNQKAWDQLAYDHHQYYLKKLYEGKLKLNPLVLKQLPDLTGKSVLHLQCNTGSDSVLLARLGAKVTAVDLGIKNVEYGRQLAEAANVNIRFIQSDVVRLDEKLDEVFDYIITFDGVLGWIENLNAWGRIVKKMLHPQGKIFVCDSHPLYLMWDESHIVNGQLVIKYPYFKKEVEVEESIGGYASDSKEATNYYFAYTMKKLLDAFSSNQLFIESFDEYDRCVPGMGGDTPVEEGLVTHRHFEGKLPILFSLWASHR